SNVQYQVPVPMKGTTKFLDAWIPETRVLIEHKSRGVNLDAPQAGHNGLTPYEQAAEYDAARSFDEKARWIITCNFDEFRIYDRTKPLAPPLTLKLANLPKEAYRLNFLVNPKEKAVDRELEISVQAGRIVGELYDAFLKQYGNSDATTLAALNRLCVRLVFCLYAEDAEIFPKDCFRRLVEASDARRLRSDLQRLFITLDTPLEKRDAYLEKEFQVFPYTNGGLFRDAAETDIPPLTEDIRKLLIGATQFDWREITPTIFGALFESTLNPVTRRAGGMVYTSVENIHKVIDPLFLAELTRRVNETASLTPSSSTEKKLKALQDEIAALMFLDPASGSGNFLTETFICLRRLENKIISALQQGQREFDLGTTVKVSISQFHGIEINDFAVSVAKTAMWIAEAQMLKETAEILHREPDYLPLKDYDGIIEGNALRMEWGSLLNVANVQMLPIAKSNSQLGNREPGTENWKLGNGTGNTTTLATFSYIMGNPPFVGYSNQSAEQKAD
ncbi:MAG: class I SAM-dependent DNA methyltransferase, partial [Kiritimatiellae bacterium]|nr:class I SAM-dependent DNA methyltransferase [Kiritimatiellia bacterium]